MLGLFFVIATHKDEIVPRSASTLIQTLLLSFSRWEISLWWHIIVVHRGGSLISNPQSFSTFHGVVRNSQMHCWRVIRLSVHDLADATNARRREVEKYNALYHDSHLVIRQKIILFGKHEKQIT